MAAFLGPLAPPTHGTGHLLSPLGSQVVGEEVTSPSNDWSTGGGRGRLAAASVAAPTLMALMARKRRMARRRSAPVRHLRPY